MVAVASCWNASSDTVALKPWLAAAASDDAERAAACRAACSTAHVSHTPSQASSTNASDDWRAVRRTSATALT